MWNKIWSFCKRWSDVLWFLPIVVILFIFNDRWIHFMDPTAQIMSVEFLVILNFNILKWILIMLGSYFIARLYFQFDIFNKNWQQQFLSNHPVWAVVISFLIWISVLIPTWIILTHNL